MVRFNVEDEPGFLSSLDYLGATAEDDVFDALENIEAQDLDWDEFVRIYGWTPVVLTGENTYPGADPLHWFAVVGTSGAEYQIAAKGPYKAIVVCAVASKRP